MMRLMPRDAGFSALRLRRFSAIRCQLFAFSRYALRFADISPPVFAACHFRLHFRRHFAIDSQMPPARRARRTRGFRARCQSADIFQKKLDLILHYAMPLRFFTLACRAAARRAAAALLSTTPSLIFLRFRHIGMRLLISA
jgi:hypothetical protein